MTTTSRLIPQRLATVEFSATQVALWAIMSSALFLRLWFFSAIEHTVDHAFPVWQALQTLDLGRWPVTSQGTSVLFDNPALLGYLYLPLIAIFRSVVPVYLAVIGLNTLAVWLVFRTAQRMFNDGRALIAAGLMAINPWLVEFSRDIWLPSLLPFFTALIAYLLFPFLTDDEMEHPERRTLLALVTLTAMTQTYLLAFAATASVGLLVILFWRRWPKRALLWGTLVFAVATGTFIAGLLSQREAFFSQLQSFSGDPASFSDEAWDHAVRLISGEDYEVARGTQAPIDDLALRRPLSRVAHWVIVAALLTGIGLTLHNTWRRGEGWRGLLASLVWFGTPILLMSYANQLVHPYYLLISSPGGYLLAAAGAGLLWRWAWGRRALAAAGLLLLPLFGANIARYHQETRAIPAAHDLWALPLNVGLQMGRATRELSAGQPSPRLVFYEWQPQIISSLSSVPIEVDNEAVTNLPALATILPDGASLYVLLDTGEDLAAPFGATEVVERAIPLVDGTTVRFYRYEDSVENLLVEHETQHVDWPTDVGLTLLAYDLSSPPSAGEQVILTTWWRVDHLNDPARGESLFAPFVHLYDASNERVLVADGVLVPGERWQRGTVYIQRILLDVPSQSEPPYVLEVGQWDPLRNVNAVFTSNQFNPTVVYRIEPEN